MLILIAATVMGLAIDPQPSEVGTEGAHNLSMLSGISLGIQPFDPRDVHLLGNRFQHATDLDQKYLLTFDPDRLLHNFRINAGLPSLAEPLGGWEAPNCELRGHFVGHYLSACALLYASTGDEQLKTKTETIVAGLAECQSKISTGYLSAFPETFFDRLEARQSVWAPYYTIHKILAGLLDVYVCTSNRQALEISEKLGDWVIARNARLSDVQLQAVLGTEHGGMNESLANLYAITGEEKYLMIARRFNHHAVLDPASRQQDQLTGLHANTQIPKFIGAARQYELTGDDKLRSASEFFWSAVVHERSYVTGGTSDNEYFTPKNKLSEALGQKTEECCNAYNLLKLTRHLFCWDPKAEYADYHERSLYNHFLASQNPETGMMCHYLPLRAGSQKHYSTPLGGLTCCTGTGIESQAKYAESIYFHSDDSLFVNLFIASELNWKTKGVQLRQETKYPDESRTRLVFTCEKPTGLDVKVRHPWWATAGMEIRVNGEKQTILSNQPSSYVVLSRTWKSGDTVDISMPFTLRTEGFRDNPNRIAFLYGPLVLCAEVSSPISGLTLSCAQLAGAFKPVAGEPNTFTSVAGIVRISSQAGNTNLKLEPFYKMHGQRHYQVYWDVVQSPAGGRGADL
jgi:DUF1680 family protein